MTVNNFIDMYKCLYICTYQNKTGFFRQEYVRKDYDMFVVCVSNVCDVCDFHGLRVLIMCCALIYFGAIGFRTNGAGF